MTGMTSMTSTKMMRVLIALVFAIVVIAVLVRMGGPNKVDQTGIGDSMVNLSAFAPKINAVEVQKGSDLIRVERGSNGWSIISRDGFPAKEETIQEVVRGLLSLKKSQRMTARADRHGELGLAWPDSTKESRRIRIFAEGSSQPIADVIVGRSAQAPSGVYVRNTGDDQAWKCVGSMSTGSDMTSWMAGPIADISADELQQVDFDGLVMTRKDGAWSVVQSAPPPAAGTAEVNPKHDAMKGTLPYLLSGFQPEDVRRETPEDLAHPNQLSVIIHLDVDHAVDARIWKEGDAMWMRLALGECSGEPNEKLTKAAAQWVGWVFKMPTWRAGHLNPLFEAPNVLPSLPPTAVPDALPGVSTVAPPVVPPTTPQ